MTLLALTSSQPPLPALQKRDGAQRAALLQTRRRSFVTEAPPAAPGRTEASRPPAVPARSLGAPADSRSPGRRSQPLPPTAADCGAAAAPHPEARRPRAAPPRPARSAPPRTGGRPSPADDRHPRGFHARGTRNHRRHTARGAASALKNARSPPTAPAMSRPPPLAPATSAAIGRAPRPSAATPRAQPAALAPPTGGTPLRSAASAADGGSRAARGRMAATSSLASRGWFCPDVYVR